MSGPTDRADALHALDILDTDAEQAFDDVAFIASQICATPIALISLLDSDRQWFKARVGLEACETPISQSVCSIDIDRNELLQICDLTQDPRTQDNPLVTGPDHLRFYAGAPLTTGGVVVGRICVIDTVPRPEGLSESQTHLIEALGRQVGSQLDARRVARTSAYVLELQQTLTQIGESIRQSRSVGEMTTLTSALVGKVLEVDRAAYGSLDESGSIVTVEGDWTTGGVQSVAGAHRIVDYGALRDDIVSGNSLVIPDVDFDPRIASDPSRLRSIDVRALMNMPVRERDRTVAILIVHSRLPRVWTDEESLFLRNVADRLQAGVARFHAEEMQQTLNGEISHRLKNMLSMVQAVAVQTFRRVVDREPIELFERRLMALSAAQDILLRNNWKVTDLEAVIRAALIPFACDDRIDVAGPAFLIGPRSALSLSLLIHELTTNACKYGALSSENGRVTLSWTIDADADPARLTMSWIEGGGPTVAVPVNRGFGSKLIYLGLTGTGGTSVRYPPTGLEAEFRALLKDLSAA